MLNNFRTYQLAKTFYKQCQGQKFKAPYKDQFDRALLSIVLNLAEGVAKPTRNDRKKFYCISLGSLREVQAILDLCDHKTLLALSDPLAASIYRLTQNPGGNS